MTLLPGGMPPVERDLAGYGRNPPDPRWPDGARLALSFVVNVEEGAELSVTRPTTEGEPITEYYRVLPGGGWEAYIDATEDSSGGGWWYTDCPDAETIEDLATCEGAPL